MNRGANEMRVGWVGEETTDESVSAGRGAGLKGYGNV